MGDVRLPAVSVVIPTHNRPQMLAEAIASNRKVDPELIEVANGILDKLVKDNEPAMKR